MTKGILVLIGIISFQISARASERICGGFMPPNNMYIPDTAANVRSITKIKFDEVLDKVQAMYEPIIRQAGGKFKIVRRWSDGTVNAYAERNGDTWMITMYGGLARHAAVTADGFMAVACHEVGHHLGGVPTYPNDWAAAEGEADYFATLKCLKRMFENEDNKTVLNGMTIDPIAKAECEAEHSSQQDQLVCIRATMAGISLAKVLASGAIPRLDTPDPSKVGSTDVNHPEAQCRLDTYYAGSLCKVPFAQDLGQTDYHIGACYTPDFATGARPRCWFKPD